MGTGLPVVGLIFAGLMPGVAPGQSAGTPSANAAVPAVRPPYLIRGDEAEQRYNTHRERLDAYYRRLGAQLEKEAPDLRAKIESPAPVVSGYQILPALTDPAPGKKRTRIVFSPFSWARTDTVISRGRDSLAMLEARLDSVIALTSADEKHRGYEGIVSEYRKRVAGQKFMSELIQYNRLWQGEIYRLRDSYLAANVLKQAAVARQALIDSAAAGDSTFGFRVKPRIDALTQQVNAGMKKKATPAFVKVEHPSEHRWIVTVPLYTDITDTAFVERARTMIESSWKLRDAQDDFCLALEIRPVTSGQLYAGIAIPIPGTHIDIAAHVARFPADGGVLTTGANTTYVLGRGVIIGPGTLTRATLVHEFSHLLGFRDNYFRAFEDRGPDGYAITEVILEPDDVFTVPERGEVRRGHFDGIIPKPPLGGRL
ncbi:MAG TPA: hypothetical protein VM166_05400 [Gemmatimonadaceae bacterium]|nr:hypothetical protein [Gemmatimonadaceae bacterium]